MDKSATNVTITTVLTAATINYPNPGKYLLDTTSNSIIVNLPQACTNPFAEWTFVYYTKSGSNTVTIVPGTDSNSIDGGIIDKYASNYVLRNEGDRVTVKAVPTLITYIGNLKYLGRYWYSLDKKLTNTFNTANAVSTTVTDGNVRISSVIEIYPINATAAGLQGSSKCLYLDSIGNGTFTVKTADNTATGTTTAQFKYVVR